MEYGSKIYVTSWTGGMTSQRNKLEVQIERSDIFQTKSVTFHHL